MIGFWLFHCIAPAGAGRPSRWRTCSRASPAGELRVVEGGHYPLSEAGARTRTSRRGGRRGKLLLDPSPLNGGRPLSCTSNMTTFADLGLSEAILAALRDVGYESPSPIQEQAIPHLLQGHDVIGQAQTGTGKTAAFGLPMVQFVDPAEHGRAGARADADARAVHPGHPGDPRLRRAQGHRPRRRLRRRPHPRPAGAAEDGRPDRGRHRRPRARPHLAPLAGAALVPLRRARRGRRDARPRLPRGRRADPRARARRPPDGAVQRHDAAADPPRSPSATSTTRSRSRSRRRR